MDRTRWTKKNGKDIFIIDLSNLREPEEIIKVVEEGKKVCLQQPEHSLLSITNVEGMSFNTQVVDAVKKLAKDTEPTAKKAVVSGMSGIQKAIFHGVQSFSNRRFEVYNTLDEAIEALSKQ
ncbi:MAG: hypothetical protein R6V53_02840 [Candidatus Woesearchaeota archaeon]